VGDLDRLHRLYGISPATAAEIRRVGEGRAATHRGFTSQRVMNPQHDIIGAAGECLLSILTGHPWERNVKLTNDGGEDFPGTDVKSRAAPHARLTRTLVHSADGGLHGWVDFYALVIVQDDLTAWRYAGWHTGAFLAAAPQRDYGHGPVCALRESQLMLGLPPPLRVPAPH
jgi:hypothetical protein